MNSTIFLLRSLENVFLSNSQFLDGPGTLDEFDGNNADNSASNFSIDLNMVRFSFAYIYYGHFPRLLIA